MAWGRGKPTILRTACLPPEFQQSTNNDKWGDAADGAEIPNNLGRINPSNRWDKPPIQLTGADFYHHQYAFAGLCWPVVF